MSDEWSTAVEVRNNVGDSVLPAQQPSNAVAQTDQTRAIAEVQAAMITARMFPRNMVTVMDDILNECQSPKMAETALYQYARGGTDISGESIRLAEMMANKMRNIHFGWRELEQRAGVTVVQAYAWDTETNSRSEISFSVPHIRHTKKGSYKLEDPRDIYEMAANQAARRKRACILALIPGYVREAAVAECEKTLKTTADTSPEGVQKMLTSFGDFDVTKEQIEKRIQRRIESITAAQFANLRKIFMSLRDGMSTPIDWFEGNAPEPTEQPKSQADEIKGKIKPAETLAATVAPAAATHSESAMPVENPAPATRPASPSRRELGKAEKNIIAQLRAKLNSLSAMTLDHQELMLDWTNGKDNSVDKLEARCAMASEKAALKMLADVLKASEKQAGGTTEGQISI